MTQEEHTDDEMKRPKKSSRITIDIDISRELYGRLRMAASQNALSLSDYVGRILIEAVPEEANITQRERHPVTRKTWEALREVRKEIMRDRGGKLFEDSVELIRQQREERTRQLKGEL